MVERIDIASKCSAIPPFPEVATQILKALKDPNAPMDRIVTLVARNAAKTAAVLKAANSGLYGRSHRIGSVPADVRLLGSAMFSQIVLRSSVKEYLRFVHAQGAVEPSLGPLRRVC